MIGTIKEVINYYLNNCNKYPCMHTSNHSLSADDTYLYSYDTVICYKRGKTLYINNNITPTTTTTSRHRNCLKNSNTSYKIKYYNGEKITVHKLIQETAKLEKLQYIL